MDSNGFQLMNFPTRLLSLSTPSLPPYSVMETSPTCEADIAILPCRVVDFRRPGAPPGPFSALARCRVLASAMLPMMHGAWTHGG